MSTENPQPCDILRKGNICVRVHDVDSGQVYFEKYKIDARHASPLEDTKRIEGHLGLFRMSIADFIKQASETEEFHNTTDRLTP